MANNDLERFMVERLLELDSTLSDSQGSRIFSVVIDPLVKRLGIDPFAVDIRTFIVDRLAAVFPEMDVLSPNAPLADTFLNPLILLLEPFKREINLVKLQKSLSDPTVLTEDETDALLSNIFVERNAGDFARGTVRVYYNAPVAAGFDSSIVFTTNDGVAFVPDEVRTYQPSEMRRSGNRYFIDIPIRSLEPVSEANVAANEIRYARNLDDAIRVTNQEPIRFGLAKETNLQVVERADRSLTERSLNTDRGIQAQLLVTFNDLVSVDVVGYGEPDMQRDILRAQVTLDTEELVGSMVFMSSRFKTEYAFNLGNSGGQIRLFPYTNILRIEASTLTTAQIAAIRAATFLRVADGANYYQTTLVSRVRKITSVSDSLAPLTGDLIIKLADFVTYPDNPDENNASAGGSVITDGDAHGYNKYSDQGSAFNLIATYDDGGGADSYVTGAQLPFSDTATVNIPIEDMPGSVIPGRDFMVIADITRNPWTLYGPPPAHMPGSFRTLPMRRLQAGNVLTMARADMALVVKSKIAYPGAADYVYKPVPETTADTETVRIIDFGCPRFNAIDATRYDGTSTLEFPSRPKTGLVVLGLVSLGMKRSIFRSR